MTIKLASLVSHNDPAVTAAILPIVKRVAELHGITLIGTEEEIVRHRGALDSLEPEAGRVADLSLCLGGDGTILRGLRASVGSEAPVFGINFGEVGFLAACDPDDVGLEQALGIAFEGKFDRLPLPGLKLGIAGTPVAFNDVCVQRRPGLRIADVAYSIGGEEVGRVRCDGVVVATPAGSTGYNLANGGPVVAWGVEGFAVSFIAPHSLTARSLVVAPDDTVKLSNRSTNEPVDLMVDGRPVGEISAGEFAEVEFVRSAAVLAQLPDSSFYHRLREKFGRLAS